jgi:hypothetical protein
MIPTLLPSLEWHGRLKLDQADRALVLGVSAATIDRLLIETKIAAAACCDRSDRSSRDDHPGPG